MSACVGGSSTITLCLGDETFDRIVEAMGGGLECCVDGTADAILFGNDGAGFISTETVTDSCG